MRSTAAGAVTAVLLLPLLVSLLSGEDYGTWWFSARGWTLLGQTLGFGALGAGASLLAGLAISRGGLGWALLACSAAVVPSSLLASAWIVTLGRSGPLAGWVTAYDWPVAAALTGLRYCGPIAVILALYRTGPDPAAKVMPVRHAWWWLGVRRAWRPVLAALLLAWVLVSFDHIMPAMFTVHTYGTQVLIQYNALMDAGGAVALATPMLIIGLLTAVGVWLTLAVTRRPDRGDVRSSVRGHVVAGLVVAGVVGLPLAVTAWRAQSLGAVTAAISDMQRELLTTLVPASAVAIVATALAWILAADFTRARRRWPVPALALINLAAPPSLIALGIVNLSGQWPLTAVRDTALPMIFALTCRFAPLAMLPIAVTMLGGERSLDAARVHDVSWWRRLRWIHWPRARRSLLTVGALVFVLVATELETTLLLVPAGEATVGVRLYTMIHTSPDAKVAAASIAVVLALAVPIAIVGAVFAVGRRRAA